MRTADDPAHFPIIFLRDVPQHYIAVGRMIFEQWPNDCNGYTSGDAYAHHLRQFDGLGVRRTWVILSSDGSSVIATVSLLDHDLPERIRWSPWIASLIVHPDYRQRGIGSRLLQYAIAYAMDSLDIPTLYLWTDGSNIAFYKARRWQCIEVIRRQQIPRFRGSVIYLFKYPSTQDKRLDKKRSS